MNLPLPVASADETLALKPLQLLVTHCAWANRQLFAALRAVDSFESQGGADLIRMALDHIHVVRCVFQAHLQGVSHGFTATQRAVFPSLAELDLESEAIDRWYVDAAMSIPPEELARPRDVRFTDGKVVTMTPAAMLLYVVTHTTHHRGNVDVIMIQAGMPRRRDGMPEFLVSRASAT
ncbi:hypothetical protein JY651_23345 [Pyxidicoccus parkwayensis]|uniref:DinB family protein n=1 Tax=Pyxidicoccus parkwayensis TaxID=2813578 RepID=A0ABX7PB38_9BACT|nr:DinB family protein [Pyxidicoccus parkwaysis]QSQ27662.1 hypothetical protein JY651_23345 [Pyxidicoccus parkwaysis]